VTELTGRQQGYDPLLDLVDGDVEPWGDDAALVEAAIQLDHDLLRAVVVDDLEFANVALITSRIEGSSQYKMIQRMKALTRK
jgi:hypothetical protein